MGPATRAARFNEEVVMTGTVTDQVTRMQELYVAFGRGDIPTVLAAMDPGIEWREAEGNPWSPGHAFVGPQQIVEGVFQRIGAEFDGFEVVPTRFLGAGDTVIMEGRYRARSHSATGKALDAEVVHVWDLREGQIVRFHQYVDTRQWANVMGVND
jgi:ketosteroid isomerase-like protein